MADDTGGTLVRRYQFRFAGHLVAGCRGAAHAEWSLAARDAVAAGHAHWASPTEIKLYDGATIEELP
jgi:hypothetical protein